MAEVLKPFILSLIACAAVTATGVAQSGQASEGVVISSQFYNTLNPDGTSTSRLLTITRMQDGTSVTKIETMPPMQGIKTVTVESIKPTSGGPTKIADLIAVRGRPLSVAEGLRKAIYRWADLEVTVVGGVVTESRGRNIDVERANEAERTRAAEERQRQAQEHQARISAATPPPAPIAVAQANGYIPRAWPSKDERIAEIRLEIEECHRTADIYFKEISKPYSQRRISPAQRDLAEAKLSRLEQELADLQK